MLIGLTGRAGCGKDTVADILVATFRYHKYSMAKPLKDVAEVFGFTKDQLYKNKEVVDEFWDITPRSFLQMVGTDLFRTHWRSDVWIKLAKKKIQPLLDAGRSVVIPDIRFDDEALFVIEMGGVVIQIDRLGQMLTGTEASHSSESGVSDNLIRHVINNTGSLHELETKVSNFGLYFRKYNDKNNLPRKF